MWTHLLPIISDILDFRRKKSNKLSKFGLTWLIYNSVERKNKKIKSSIPNSLKSKDEIKKKDQS